MPQLGNDSKGSWQFAIRLLLTSSLSVWIFLLLFAPYNNNDDLQYIARGRDFDLDLELQREVVMSKEERAKERLLLLNSIQTFSFVRLT